MRGTELLFSDRNGVYIPKMYAEMVNDYLHLWESVSREDIDLLLKGPEEESYWDVWNDVVQWARYTDEEGKVWRLHQDGDLFAYCDERMSDEEYFNFWGEKRDE